MFHRSRSIPERVGGGGGNPRDATRTPRDRESDTSARPLCARASQISRARFGRPPFVSVRAAPLRSRAAHTVAVGTNTPGETREEGSRGGGRGVSGRKTAGPEKHPLYPRVSESAEGSPRPAADRCARSDGRFLSRPRKPSRRKIWGVERSRRRSFLRTAAVSRALGADAPHFSRTPNHFPRQQVRDRTDAALARSPRRVFARARDVSAARATPSRGRLGAARLFSEGKRRRFRSAAKSPTSGRKERGKHPRTVPDLPRAPDEAREEGVRTARERSRGIQAVTATGRDRAARHLSYLVSPQLKTLIRFSPPVVAPAPTCQIVRRHSQNGYRRQGAPFHRHLRSRRLR
jgi:hypothetical protein